MYYTWKDIHYTVSGLPIWLWHKRKASIYIDEQIRENVVHTSKRGGGGQYGREILKPQNSLISLFKKILYLVIVVMIPRFELHQVFSV